MIVLKIIMSVAALIVITFVGWIMYKGYKGR